MVKKKASARRTRRTHNPAFKAQVALALMGEVCLVWGSVAERGASAPAGPARGKPRKASPETDSPRNLMDQAHAQGEIQEPENPLHLSTAARSNSGSRSWVNIRSARWVKIRSAPTPQYAKLVQLADVKGSD